MNAVETPRRTGPPSLVTWCLGGVLFLTAILYSPSLRNEFVYDDHFWIGNPHLGDWSFLWKSISNNLFWFHNTAGSPAISYYRPVQTAWFMLNDRLFGRDPIGWHAGTIALHLIVVWLVYRVASMLTDELWTGLIAAALFALMPIHAEAVIWTSAASYPLCAAFELGAFALYLHPTGARRAISLLLFGGALLSHDSAIVFPALVAIHGFLLQPHGSYKSDRSYFSGARAAIAAAWPYALEAAVYLAMRFAAIGFVSDAGHRHHVSPASLIGVLAVPRTIVRYAMLLVFPWMAGPAHRLASVSSVAVSGFYLPAAALIVIAGASFALLRHHPHRRLYLFCAVWILIALAPAFMLTSLGLQDRYLYIPSVGFCAMVADLAIVFARRARPAAIAAAIAGTAVAIVCAVRLVSVEGAWHSDVTLSRRCIANDPDNAGCHKLLGLALEVRGELAAARPQLEAAVNLDPKIQWDVFRELSGLDRRLGDRPAAEQALSHWIGHLDPASAGAYAQLAPAADAAGDAKGTAAAIAQAAALPG
ncbi:MAG: hypothetical protein ACREQI_11475, partial [Candidatus Binataceae bacterium]